MKFDTIEVTGFRGAIWGMRMPMSKDLVDAKNKCDSTFYVDGTPQVFGSDDLRVCRNRIKADDIKGKTGTPESKFLQMIHVQVSIQAPLYWWSEMDTYRIGVVKNSTSKMHKLASTPITKDCFEMDDFEPTYIGRFSKYANITDVWAKQIEILESLRLAYNETKDKRYWKELIRLLPESWLQTRVVDTNYQTLRNICCWREDHKLNEWSGKDNSSLPNFIAWAHTLPYADELIFYKGDKSE